MARPVENLSVVPEASGEASGEFVCQLIEVQSELRSFIAHLMPFVDARNDILQEVNLRVWQKREQFRPGSNFRAWVFTFARNVTMTYQKRARRENQLLFSPETVAQLASEFIEDDPSIDERLPALRQCLEKVPAEERQLLIGRYQKHGAIKEAARESGRSAAALRGTLHRLRIALRRCVEVELKQELPGSS